LQWGRPGRRPQRVLVWLPVGSRRGRLVGDAILAASLGLRDGEEAQRNYGRYGKAGGKDAAHG
jgi:hypothetical protein